MLDLKWVRQNFGKLKENLVKRGTLFNLKDQLDLLSKKGLNPEPANHEISQTTSPDPQPPKGKGVIPFLLKNLDLISIPILEQFQTIEADRRKAITEVESFKAERNQKGEEVARLKKGKQDATALLEEMKSLAQKIKEFDLKVTELDKKTMDLLVLFPNILDESVPLGLDESENETVKTWGTPNSFSFPPKDHVELGKALDILDFERGALVSGSGFTLLKSKGALLERALSRFMIDIHTKEHHCTEYSVPFAVKEESMFATGQLPDKEDLLYKCEKDDLYLIPTAEVPLTNIFRGEIFARDKLPVYLCGWTPCFRREAGSYGKDVRGLIRQHQFQKVELVKLVHPHRSFDELESLTRNAEEVLRRLQLPYRVVALCSGDTGFASSKTYDIEVWLPSQQCFREISSCSHFGTFQSNRGKIRFREEVEGKPEFVHTLNGSGLAVGRTLVALLENNQDEEGRVKIPEALIPYMDGIRFLCPDGGWE